MKKRELVERMIKKVGQNIDWGTNYSFFELKENFNLDLLRALSRIGKLLLVDENTLTNETLEHQVNNFEIEVAHPHYEPTDCWCGPRDEKDYETVGLNEINNISFNYVYFKF